MEDAPPPSTIATHLAHEHVYGNFHDYYEFNPEFERLRFLTPDIHSALRSYFRQVSNNHGRHGTFLDVGCNEGKLTMGLFDALRMKRTFKLDENASFSTDSITQLNHILQQAHVLPEYIMISDMGTGHRPEFTMNVYIFGVYFGEGRGVSKKVARAKAASNALEYWSTINQTIDTHNINTTNESSIEQESFLDESPIELKALGIDIDNILITRAKKDFQNQPNVTFETCDIMRPIEAASIFAPFLSNLNDCRFDLVTCFSITMWIHLNHGDYGLCTFLDAVSKIATHLIIEPQPWKCYRTAITRLKRKSIRNPFKPIKQTTNVQEFIQEKLSEWFPHKVMLGKTNWSRQVWLYSRTPLPGLSYN